MTHFPFEESGAQTKVAAIAAEIAGYLQKADGNTAETLEGILEWWIPQQRILEERYWVEQAIQHLCNKGVLSMRKNLDGRVLYSAVPPAQPSLDE